MNLYLFNDQKYQTVSQLSFCNSTDYTIVDRALKNGATKSKAKSYPTLMFMVPIIIVCAFIAAVLIVYGIVAAYTKQSVTTGTGVTGLILNLELMEIRHNRSYFSNFIFFLLRVNPRVKNLLLCGKQCT